MIKCTYFTKAGLHNSPLQGGMVVSLNYLAKMPESEITLSKVGHGVVYLVNSKYQARLFMHGKRKLLVLRAP